MAIQERSQLLDVLYVGTLPPHPGGTAIVAQYLLPGLARRGHRVRAIAPIATTNAMAGDRFADAHPEMSVHRVEVPYFETSPDVPPTEAYRSREGELIAAALRDHIGHRRPDVIVAGRETFAWHVPDVAIAHSLPSAMLVQGGTTFGILKGTIPQPMATRLLDQFRKMDLMIVVARHLAAALGELGFTEAVVIENAVDAQAFAPTSKCDRLLQELDIRPDDTVVMHVSNLKALKRPLDVVASAEEVLRHHPHTVYVIVGDGPLRGEVERACQQRGIAERFRFAGWVPHDRVADYLNLADIVVMPSAAEARPLVHLETQACGRVLVASDIPAARELVVHGETGLLFASGDVDAMTAMTMSAAGDPVLRTRIGRRAREVALGRSLDDMLLAYELALGDLVRRGPDVTPAVVRR